jgi:hypothetical protein
MSPLCAPDKGDFTLGCGDVSCGHELYRQVCEMDPEGIVQTPKTLSFAFG